MSDDIKNVQVRVPRKLYKKAKEKLEEDGRTWQGFFLSQIKKLVNPKRKKRK